MTVAGNFMGTLYVIGTPIGNLGDITPRAAELLRTVDLVVAEDTRVTRKLLTHLGAHTPCISFREHSGPAQLVRVLKALEAGDVAQVTDAGSPSVSDPGPALVDAAAGHGHAVVAVPGPSAVTAALSVSGMPGDRFLFLGFLPRRAADRREVLSGAAGETGSLVAFETPQRVVSALQDIAATLGDRRITVCREMTKMHEEVFRGTVSTAAERFSEGPPRGEFVLVIEGAPRTRQDASDAEVSELVECLSARGLSGRSLVDAVVEATGAPRRRVYRLVTGLKADGSGGS